jgi:uncharacterized membrane protein
MATLTAFRFDTVDGAEHALQVLFMLEQQQVISVLDTALVSWPKGKNRPSTRHAVAANGTTMLDGTFWGMLFGLIFFVPVLSGGLRSGTVGMAAALSDVGIDDNFIYEVRSKVTEGSSALFLLSRDALVDRIVEASQGVKPDLIATNLPPEQEMKLRNLFASALSGGARGEP